MIFVLDILPIFRIFVILTYSKFIYNVICNEIFDIYNSTDIFDL